MISLATSGARMPWWFAEPGCRRSARSNRAASTVAAVLRRRCAPPTSRFRTSRSRWCSTRPRTGGPGRQRLCHLGREITYRELRHDVEQLSTCLARLGVAHGDRVGMVLPNCPQLVIALFATLRLGAVAVPLSPGCPARGRQRCCADSGAEVVLCSDRLYEQVAAVRADRERCSGRSSSPSSTDYLPALDRIALNVPARSVRRERARAASSVPLGAGVRMWGEELRRARGLPVPAPGKGIRGIAERRPRSPGSSPEAADPAGPSRGLVLTSRNLRAAGAQAAAWLTHARPGRECVLVGLPLPVR